MSKSLRIATIDEYKKALSRKDAILEQNIYTDALSEYLNLGGLPMDAVNLLSESYLGLPSMCNATSISVDSIGLNSHKILRKAIRQQLKNRFDPNRCDKYFMQLETHTAPQWLDVLIQDPHWRETMYELLEKYPSSSFLNFAILRIAEAGHEREIAKLRTASTYVKVYNLILEDALTELVVKDDSEFDQDIPKLVRVCCEREDTYLYAQTLLGRLYDEFGATPFTRLRRELESAARNRGNHVFVDFLHSHVSHAPIDLSRTIKSLMNSTNITPGDLISLKRFYSCENPPATMYLCDYDLIIKMLKSLYVPHDGLLLRADMVDDVTYLISYATTINDTKPKLQQKDDVFKVQLVLKDLYTCLSTKTEVGSITGAMKYIISAIRFPIGSMGVLLWIEYMAIQTAYFETYFRTKETPSLLLILDEISDRHQLQQAIVFDVIKRCIKHKTDTFAPEFQLALQRTWVDRMLYLVQLNYTLPVLKYFSGVGRELDDSLIVHFVKKVLRMASAPYTVTFVEHMVHIVEPLIENLTLIKDVQQLVVDFLEEALDGSEPMTEKLKQSMISIIRKCK
ncbi:TH1 protein [Thamnidium elegans]|nr:TH1 protein [Thamnidium elegans]